jgi:hypothetical protein
MKLFSQFNFFSKIKKESEDEEELQREDYARYNQAYLYSQPLLELFKNISNRRFERILELTSKPALQMTVDDSTLNKIICTVEGEIKTVEYGCDKWHYLQGQLEGLQTIYKIVSELPVYTVEQE